jgi:hypothetical protein
VVGSREELLERTVISRLDSPRGRGRGGEGLLEREERRERGLCGLIGVVVCRFFGNGIWEKRGKTGNDGRESRDASNPAGGGGTASYCKLLRSLPCGDSQPLCVMHTRMHV